MPGFSALVMSSPRATLYNPIHQELSAPNSLCLATLKRDRGRGKQDIPYRCNKSSLLGLLVNFFESMTAVSKSDILIDGLIDRC